MVAKRIRTEYMKRFKDPKWESYAKCYEETVQYRRSRRLLEHSHNPWFWSESDSDSEAGESQPPPGEPATEEDIRQAEYEECAAARADRQQEQRSKSTKLVPDIPGPEEGTRGQSAGVRRPPGGEHRVRTGEGDQLTLPKRHRDPARQTETPHQQQNKTSKTTKPSQHVHRVRLPLRRKPWGENKDGKHPFALYGCGERHADTAAKKTHNVRPTSSTMEIHESALRAKTRREVEFHIQNQKAERRKTKSADLDGNGTRLPQPEFNPWLTEYMRCFSRTR